MHDLDYLVSYKMLEFMTKSKENKWIDFKLDTWICQFYFLFKLVPLFEYYCFAYWIHTWLDLKSYFLIECYKFDQRNTRSIDRFAHFLQIYLLFADSHFNEKISTRNPRSVQFVSPTSLTYALQSNSFCMWISLCLLFVVSVARFLNT